MHARISKAAHLVVGAALNADLQGGVLAGGRQRIPGVGTVGRPGHKQVVARRPEQQVLALRLLQGLHRNGEERHMSVLAVLVICMTVRRPAGSHLRLTGLVGGQFTVHSTFYKVMMCLNACDIVQVCPTSVSLHIERVYCGRIVLHLRLCAFPS